MDEIVQGLAFQGIVGHPLLGSGVHRLPVVAVGRSGIVTPAALKYDCTVVSRIFDGSHLVEHSAALYSRENLAAHKAHSLCTAVSSGYGTDAYAVVVHRAYDSGHVGAVSAVVLVGSGNNRSPERKIVTVHVSGISVAVIVFVGAPDFALIHPQGILEVRMGYVYTLVEHSHDDGRVTGTKLPGLFHTHVGSFAELGRSHIAVIHKMPLELEVLIVEITGPGSLCGKASCPECYGFA